MLLFDMHTHCFPDALAPKALPRLAEISACSYHGDGTYGDLCAKGCRGRVHGLYDPAHRDESEADEFRQQLRGGLPEGQRVLLRQRLPHRRKTRWTSCTASGRSA